MLTLMLIWLIVAPDLSCLAQQKFEPADCFSSSVLVGAVLGTFFATLTLVAISLLFWWVCCSSRANQGNTFVYLLV